MRIDVIVILVLFVFSIGFTVFYQQNYAEEYVPGDNVCFDRKCFSVEIANSESERALGLMDRDFLEGDSGMLFIFEDSRIYPFWMKNTLIELDIIWVNRNMEIVYIEHGAMPCPSDEQCVAINPHVEALYVVELNSGKVAEYDLSVGDKVVMKFD